MQTKRYNDISMHQILEEKNILTPLALNLLCESYRKKDWIKSIASAEQSSVTIIFHGKHSDIGNL